MLFLVTSFVSVSVLCIATVLAEDRLPLRPETCLMPPSEGDCGAAQQNRWFFEVGTGSCRQFLFLGCPSVGNNFETQEECHRICAEAGAAEDDLQQQPEESSPSETLSNFPVDPAALDSTNAKLTTAALVVFTGETKNTNGRLAPEATPPPPSGFQKELSGSEKDKVTQEPRGVATPPIQMASDYMTLVLPTGRNHGDEKSAQAQGRDVVEGPWTPRWTPGSLQRSAKDQPLSSNSDPYEAKRAQPLAEPSSDDDYPGQRERSGHLTDKIDDASGNEEPADEKSAGMNRLEMSAEQQQDAGQIRSEEAPKKGDRQNEPKEKPSFQIPRRSSDATNNGILTSVQETSQQSDLVQLARESTPKPTFPLRENMGRDRGLVKHTDNQERRHEYRLSGQSTRNSEDFKQRKENADGFRKMSGQEVIENPATYKIPTRPKTSINREAVTRSPNRAKSSLDTKTRPDDLPLELAKEKHATTKEGMFIDNDDSGNLQKNSETTPLLDIKPHRVFFETSKTPRTTTNPSEESTDRINSRNAIQPPASKEPPVAMPVPMKRDGMTITRNMLSTGGDTKISGGNLATRTNTEVPVMRHVLSELDYRRPAFCSLHRLRGHCTEHSLRWYFDPVNGSCQAFNYSGCGGNSNNFQNPDTCLTTCTGNNRPTERSRPQNDLEEFRAIFRTPRRFAEPDWRSGSASLADPDSPQSVGLQFFLDRLRRKLLPPPPPPPPAFLRSMAFPFLLSGGPGDTTADQKMLMDDNYVEDLDKPSFKDQQKAKESTVPSEKHFNLLGKASVSGPGETRQPQQPPKAQRPRTAEIRIPRIPEKAMTDSDAAALRSLLHQDARESPIFIFDPTHFGLNPGTSAIQKSRPTVYQDTRKTDKVMTGKLGEIDQTQFEERLPITQQSQRQKIPSRAAGVQRIGQFVNNGRSVSQELKNLRWIEQSIVVSDLAPGRPDLPTWLREDRIKHVRVPVQPPNWREPAESRSQSNAGNSQNALMLRRNSAIFEARQRAKKVQDFEREKDIAGRPQDKTNVLMPRAGKPERVMLSSGRWPPSDLPKQIPSSLAISSHSFPVRGKGDFEIPFHVFQLTRPLVEQLAGRAGVSRGEQSHVSADLRLSGSREDPRLERTRTKIQEQNWQEQDKERPPQSRRDRIGFSNRLPNDRFTSLQIFVNRELGPYNQHRFSKPDLEDLQLLSQIPRSHFDPSRFQTNQNDRYLPRLPVPPPPQLSPRQQPSQILRETIIGEQDWLPASEFELPQPNEESGSPSIGSFGSDVNEDSTNRRDARIPVVCQLPLDPGPCNGYQPVWFFDQRRGTCHLFYYGGCSGNGNRFDTRDECLQTCDGYETMTDGTEFPSPVDGSDRQPSEDSGENVIVFTSPVYGEVEDSVRDAAEDHVARPLMTTQVPILPGDGERGQEESGGPLEAQGDAKATDGTTASNGAGESATTEVALTGEDAEANKEEDLSKTFSTQYITIVTALGVVGIAVVLMVILSIARLCRRVRMSKREHCIQQEVIKSHMYGDLPHGLYSESPSSADSDKESQDKK